MPQASIKTQLQVDLKKGGNASRLILQRHNDFEASIKLVPGDRQTRLQKTCLKNLALFLKPLDRPDTQPTFTHLSTRKRR